MGSQPAVLPPHSWITVRELEFSARREKSQVQDCVSKQEARRSSLEAESLTLAASTPRRWEHFEHAADMGVRGIGATREAAFEEAALALCAVITDPALVRPDILFEVDCHATNDEFLLVDWLNALISEMSVHRMIFSKFEVTISDGRLHGRAWGETAVPARHHPAVEVKGATLTELKVFQNPDGLWTAQCVVDV